MTEIIVPPPPRRRTANERIAESVIPSNRNEAVKKLERFRAKRKPRKPTVQHYVRVTKLVSDVLRDIEEQYDITLNAILNRFVEDGIKKYTPELAEKAGLTSKPNPFNANGSVAAQPQFRAYDHTLPIPPEAYVPRVVAANPPADPIYTAPDEIPGPSGGPPIPMGVAPENL